MNSQDTKVNSCEVERVKKQVAQIRERIKKETLNPANAGIQTELIQNRIPLK